MKYTCTPSLLADFDLDVSHASEAWRHAIENSDNLAKFTEKTEVIRICSTQLLVRHWRVHSQRLILFPFCWPTVTRSVPTQAQRFAPCLAPLAGRQTLAQRPSRSRSPSLLSLFGLLSLRNPRPTCFTVNQLHFMNPPREGKSLLVLDLDHTLLDFSSRVCKAWNADGSLGGAKGSRIGAIDTPYNVLSPGESTPSHGLEGDCSGCKRITPGTCDPQALRALGILYSGFRCCAELCRSLGPGVSCCPTRKTHRTTWLTWFGITCPLLRAQRPPTQYRPLLANHAPHPQTET